MAAPDRAGVDRLYDVVTRQATALGFVPVARFDGPLEQLPADVLTDVERVLDEALSNIAGHARARAASVTVRLAGDALAVQVSDDGIGCAGAPRDGGLADLRRRAAWYGGTLTVTPGPSGGTELTWAVSLRHPHPPA